MNKTPSKRELRSLFCEQFTCAPADFEKRVFWKCLYPHARIIAPLLCLILPALFERDHHFIRCLGHAKNWQDVKVDILDLHYEDRFHPRFLRNALRLRVSRRKAKRLAAGLFAARNSVQRLPNTEASTQKTGGPPQDENLPTPERPLFGLERV